jgi:catechol 2,3-dioxygenase-like lactoylglutathione lyase family enzyme
MNIRRTVPNIKADHLEESRAFFEDFLGMDMAMKMDQIITFVSPNNPTAQLSVIRNEKPETPHPNISIEVADVDEMYSRALEQDIEIVYDIRNEPWGVRRFFVKYSGETIINILSHL